MFENNVRKIIYILALTCLTILAWNLLVHNSVITNIVVSILMLALGVMFCGWVVQYDRISKLGFEYGAIEERLGYRSDLLEVLTASEPRSIVLADKWERVLFANREAASRAQRDSDSLIGTTIANVSGDKKAALTTQRLQTAYKNKTPVIQVDEENTGMLRQVLQTSFIPIPNTKYIKDSVLITETDITSIILERENREKTLRQLLDVCVAIIDKRDPFAAGHSALVGELAKAVAMEMHLNVMERETAEISGLLMNFGKVLVPQEILTKTTALTKEELQLVRESMMSSADVLSLIQFDDMPVVETLRQIFEHVDGTGPQGRKGDHIIPTALICNAANSFVALASRRAHRAGLEANTAIDILKKDTGSVYDPAVIRALEAVIKEGRLQKRIDSLSKQAISAA